MLQSVSSSDEGAVALNPVEVDVPAPVPFEIARTRKDVFGALLRAKREFGAKTTAVIDGDGTKFDYLTITRGAFALGNALKPHTRKAENVGVLLPTGIGAMLAF